MIGKAILRFQWIIGANFGIAEAESDARVPTNKKAYPGSGREMAGKLWKLSSTAIRIRENDATDVAVGELE